MQSAEHAQESRRLVERAQREFDAGDLPIASELLWGAAAHAIMSVAVARDWPIDSHGSFKAAIMRISTEQRADHWHSDFDNAENLHAHFYHHNLPPDEIAHQRQRTELLISRLLRLTPQP